MSRAAKWLPDKKIVIIPSLGLQILEVTVLELLSKHEHIDIGHSRNNSVYKYSIREISQPLQGHRNKDVFVSYNPLKSSNNYFADV